jgi:hypothetical protein
MGQKYSTDTMLANPAVSLGRDFTLSVTGVAAAEIRYQSPPHLIPPSPAVTDITDQ